MIHLGIVGLGVMGKNHYRVAQEISGIEVAAICDLNELPEVDVPQFRHYEKMLDSINLDAVVIAVPTRYHFAIAEACIKRGLHLLIEKPVTSNVEDGRRLKKLAETNEVNVVIGHIERFNPVVNSLRHAIAGKDVISITISRVGPFPPRITDVGVLTDLAVHDIDLLLHLSGKDITRKSIFSTKSVNKQFEDNAILQFKLGESIVACITTNWITPFKKRTIEVATVDSYFEADLQSQELKEYSNFKLNNSCVVRNCFVRKGEPLRIELESFKKHVEGNHEMPFASIDDSIRTLEAIADFK